MDESDMVDITLNREETLAVITALESPIHFDSASSKLHLDTPPAL